MKHFLAGFFILLAGGTLVAKTQSLPGDSLHIANHSIYLEIFGTGGFGSINYEYYFFQKKQLALAARVGLSTYHLKDFQNKFNPELIVPLTFKVLYGKKHKAEIGIGETFTSTIHAAETNFKPERQLNAHTHFSVGYRYQPVKRGLIYGIAYTPILEFNHSLRHWGGASIGYSF
jgi:hypothetical protein